MVTLWLKEVWKTAATPPFKKHNINNYLYFCPFFSKDTVDVV